jgi:hydroxylamine reductase (hybrid-cluster protein)
MFNSFSKNLEDTSSCQSSGVCTLDPITTALDALILKELMEATFYMIKAHELGYENKDLVDKIIKVLCINFLDSNISEKDYVDLYEKILHGKNSIKNIYKKLCKKNAHQGEILTPIFKSKPAKLTLINLIIEGQKILTVKNKGLIQETVKLFDLIIILCKWTSTNIQKIKELEPDFDKYDFEILRFFNITNFLATRKEKLKRRIDEFLTISYETQKKLDQVLIENYGEKTSREILLSTRPGKSILVGGDNLRELKLLLDAVSDKDINVYTYDVLFQAHFYSEFQKYKNLKGHVKYTDVTYDFGNFQGSIFITKYSNQRLDNIYKGFIYTSTFFPPRGVAKIQNEEFDNLIKSTLSNEGYAEKMQERKVFMRYNKEEIEDIIKKLLSFLGR